MSTTLDNKTVQTHIIIDSDFMYLWNTDSKTGYKLKTDTTQNTATSSATNNSIDLNQQVNVNCANWSVNPNAFNLPEDINFTDMTTILKTPNQNLKSACDQITDPTAKAACISALNK